MRPATMGNFDNLLDPMRFAHIQRVSKVFAESRMVPEQYRKNLPDCIIAVQMAVRLRVDPFMFMQNTYVVHGRPGMEAKLAIALVNSRGPFTGPIQWKLSGEGDSRTVEAYAIHGETGDRCAAKVDVKMAKAEGWWQKNGSKWPTMTDLMLMYRSAMFLARLYAPECIMGMQSIDEVLDSPPAARFVEHEDASERGAKAVAKVQAPPPEPEEAPEATTEPEAPASDLPEAEPVEIEQTAGKPPDATEAPEINADLQWILEYLEHSKKSWKAVRDEIGECWPDDLAVRGSIKTYTDGDLKTIRGLMGG